MNCSRVNRCFFAGFEGNVPTPTTVTSSINVGKWYTSPMDPMGYNSYSTVHILDSRLDGGFKYSFIFTSAWGNDPIWQIFFSDGLVQPPTSRTVLKFAWLLELFRDSTGCTRPRRAKAMKQGSCQWRLQMRKEFMKRWWSHWYEGGKLPCFFSLRIIGPSNGRVWTCITGIGSSKWPVLRGQDP